MKLRFLIAPAVLAAAALAAVGCHLTTGPVCGFRDVADSRTTGDPLSVRNPMAPLDATAAPPDSHPTPDPPPRPTPEPRLTVAFNGSDAVEPGQTSITRWSFGNAGHSTLAVNWTLTEDHGLPDFPKQGTLSLAPLSTQSLEVPVAVPDSMPPSFVGLFMSATSGSRLSATAQGLLVVTGPDSTGARR